jgi:hypothetical protein
MTELWLPTRARVRIVTPVARALNKGQNTKTKPLTIPRDRAVVACQAHNLKVEGSNPSPATNGLVTQNVE